MLLDTLDLISMAIAKPPLLHPHQPQDHDFPTRHHLS